MKKLVVHADDLGLSEGVSDGILSAFQKGAVTSASILVNFADSRRAIRKAREIGFQDLGWHINLTQGKPVSPPETIPSLVGKDGSFHPLKKLILKSLMRSLDVDEVEKELRAQLEILEKEGVAPTHADGHHHIHILPMIREGVRKILTEKKIPFVRLPRERGGMKGSRFGARLFLGAFKGSRPEFWTGTGLRSIPFFGFGLGEGSGDFSTWKNYLQRIWEEAADVMVHPGLPLPSDRDEIAAQRHREWNLLTSSDWKKMVGEMGFELVGFRDLVQK
jgi:predicted glycoside hydrolase/deacetylase ChbG (UPF0249 family)